MTFAVRKCSSFHTDDRDMRGIEIVIEIGPFGLQLFIGKAR